MYRKNRKFFAQYSMKYLYRIYRRYRGTRAQLVTNFFCLHCLFIYFINYLIIIIQSESLGTYWFWILNTWVGFISQLFTCDSVKVPKLPVIFVKMTSFLFNSFIETTFETCDEWLKNCAWKKKYGRCSDTTTNRT